MNDMTSKVNMSEVLQRYQAEIQICIENYLPTLHDADDIYKYPMCFTGLLQYIYEHVFAGRNKDGFVYDSKLSCNDLAVMDKVFIIYVNICSHFRHIPTLLRFALMIGLDTISVKDILSGANDRNVNKNCIQLIKKWDTICESGLYDRVSEDNSIGSMFLLKAKYSYRESPNELVITTNNLPQLSKNDLLSLTDVHGD